MSEHPIQPSQDLLDNWIEFPISEDDRLMLSAQWGADQELEACVEWLEQNQGRWEIPASLRAARRPKPPSLKEKAFGALDRLTAYNGDTEARSILFNILETLPDD